MCGFSLSFPFNIWNLAQLWRHCRDRCSRHLDYVDCDRRRLFDACTRSSCWSSRREVDVRDRYSTLSRARKVVPDSARVFESWPRWTTSQTWCQQLNRLKTKIDYLYLCFCCEITIKKQFIYMLWLFCRKLCMVVRFYLQEYNLWKF